MKTDTPRTDAQEWDWNEDCCPADDMIVSANFARQLERESAQYRAVLEKIKTWADQAMSAVYDTRISAAFEQISDEADYVLSNASSQMPMPAKEDHE